MIIIKGRSRGDGGQLASYLTKKGDNGRIEVLGMRGFARDDLRGGLRLAEAEAELSQGKKPLWHAQINPAEGVRLTREQQMMAVDVLEKRLGLKGQPRAVVLHEKDGREHLHVVWSRYDRETGKLRRDSFSKMKNVVAAAEIAVRLGLEPNRDPFSAKTDLPLTREDRREASKAADTHAEQQQASRSEKTRQDRKTEITALWNATDSGHALRVALEEAGYTLALGTRGPVVVDGNGEVHSLARQIEGVRVKDVRARLVDIDLASLRQAEDIQRELRQARQDRARVNERVAAATDGQGPIEAPVEFAKSAVTPHVGSAREPPLDRAQPKPDRVEPAGMTPPASREEIPARSAEQILASMTLHHSTFTRQELARQVDLATGGGGYEPWMMKTGGLESLNGEARLNAERSYQKWTASNPELTPRVGFARYVSFVQGRQAERDAADPEAVKVRTETRQVFAALMAEVDASPKLIRLGQDHNGRETFTTRDMLDTELRMQAASVQLVSRQGHAVTEKLRRAVPGLDKLGAEQRAAFEHVTAAGDLALVVGYAGTGKSRTLGLAREAWEAAGLRVRGTALSGIAAEGLQNDAGIQSRTLHSLLHQLDTIEGKETALRGLDEQLAAYGPGDGLSARQKRQHDRDRAYLAAKRSNMAADLEAARLTRRDVVVLDEAAMVGSRQMQRLLSAAEQAGAKIVLVGDHEQLQAIDAGAAFRALRNAHGAQEITEVRRQAGEERQWMRDATQEFGRAETATALARYRTAGMTLQSETRDQAKAALVTAWTKARQQDGQRSQIILAYTRADVAELNGLARAAYREEGRLGEDVVLKTGQGDKAFAAGDRLYFTRNDTRLGVRNGTLGAVAAIEGDRVTVALDNGRSVGFDTRDYGHVTHGYAATVHKSQGVTVDQAHVLASRFMDRHAAYVGMTRHRDRADLYFGRDEFKDFETLSRRLSRHGAKGTTLDFLMQADGRHIPDHLKTAFDDCRQHKEAAPNKSPSMEGQKGFPPGDQELPLDVRRAATGAPASEATTLQEEGFKARLRRVFQANLDRTTKGEQAADQSPSQTHSAADVLREKPSRPRSFRGPRL